MKAIIANDEENYDKLQIEMMVLESQIISDHNQASGNHLQVQLVQGTEALRLYEECIKPFLSLSLRDATNVGENLRNLLSDGICLAIHEQDWKQLDSILSFAYTNMLLLHIDFKALNFLVDSQQVEIMRLLIKHLVQYRGSHTDEETKNILARNLMSMNKTPSDSP